jgi:hypothetical protein
MESMRKRINIELVCSQNRMTKFINSTTFKYCTSYNENLTAVSSHHKKINFCKPIFIGFTVLDLSKTLMYKYHVMKIHFKDIISLLYTDTGTFLYNYKLFSYLKLNIMLIRFIDFT